jgi:hypothetical protein
MEWYRQLQQWQWAHNTLALDLVRIFLGVALCIRGVLFLISAKSFSVNSDTSNE